MHCRLYVIPIISVSFFDIVNFDGFFLSLLSKFPLDPPVWNIYTNEAIDASASRHNGDLLKSPLSPPP